MAKDWDEMLLVADSGHYWHWSQCFNSKDEMTETAKTAVIKIYNNMGHGCTSWMTYRDYWKEYILSPAIRRGKRNNALRENLNA